MAFEPLPSPTDPVTEEFVADFLRRDYGAWNVHDADAVLQGWTEDVLWESPFVGTGQVSGYAEARAVLLSLWRALPDLEITLPEAVYLSPDGRRAANVWRGSGTMSGPLAPPGFAPTGGRVEMVGVDLWEFRGGRACHIRTVTDMAAAARQVGGIPPPGSFGERLGVAVQRLSARRRRRRNRRRPA
jgi:ketosteroid isomerase-like protein